MGDERGMALAKRNYVGLKSNGKETLRVVFKSDSVPTFETHGKIFDAVIGPFQTIHGAEFMRDFGAGNPHCRCVSEASRHGRPEW